MNISASTNSDYPGDLPRSGNQIGDLVGDAGENPKSSSSQPNRPSSNGGSSSADPFADINRLRLSQNFSSQAAVKAVITTIAVRKPNRHEFVRTRPGGEWRFETGCFIDGDAREVYLVAPELCASIAGEIQPTVLVVTISRSSPVPFLWPISLPGPDGRPNRWHESALEAARHAEQSWLRVASDLYAGCYVPHIAAANLPEPVWPADLTLAELLRLAFRDRFVNSLDHIVLKRLRGEV